jgi:hypothetical protein
MELSIGGEGTTPRMVMPGDLPELVEAGLDDEAISDADAIEAFFRKLNADEAEAARRYLSG